MDLQIVGQDEHVGEHVTFQPNGFTIEPGQWFWVLSNAKDQKGNAVEDDTDGFVDPPDGKVRLWLGCITHIGTNYVLIQEPLRDRSQRGLRVHIDNFWTSLLFEPRAEEVTAAKALRAREESARLMGRIQALTARLGVGQASQISTQLGTQRDQPAADREERALVVMSSAVDANAYKAALIEARDNTLPELFEQMKDANHTMLQWLSAGALAMTAQASGLSDVIGEIKQRLFTVSLYAGLTEEAVLVRDGQPAAPDEKVRVMQQRLYADEECLMHYRTGGMEFKDIEAFDAWLAEPEHMNSLLPFPRCLVAMRVRRNVKDREFDGSLASAFIIMRLDQTDKSTFLYLRNGDKLYRLSTELDFDEWIFPSKDEFDPCEPLMFSTFGYRVDKVITRAEYDERLAAETLRRRQYDAWEKEQEQLKKDASEKNWPFENTRNPFWKSDEEIIRDRWHPFDRSSVYYDEAAAAVAERVRKYNRVATILQGLFDRSAVFHPHPPVQTWTPEGFARAIELVYDGSGALNNGEPPDFEAYRARLNASLNEDSVVVGQERFWMEKEAERENRRIDNDWRDSRKQHHKLFKPWGNGGPGFVATLSGWKARSKVAQFNWLRKRMRGAGYYGDDFSHIACTLEVPAEHLLNITAYQPGDFKQFYADRRTRAQYLKWAPYLLAAEEFHAGHLEPKKPGELTKAD